MDLIMPQVFDRIKASSGELVRCKKYNIGPWNMDTNNLLDVSWTWADLTKILSVEIIILSDDGTYMLLLCGATNSVTGKASGGISAIRNTYIRLFRTDGEIFDGIAFDDAVMNRGYIFVWYIE